MKENEIEHIQVRIARLEKRLEMYYQLLYMQNELDFVLKGGYILDTDLQNILNGNY